MMNEHRDAHHGDAERSHATVLTARMRSYAAVFEGNGAGEAQHKHSIAQHCIQL
jgi:hypothetical protein